MVIHEAAVVIKNLFHFVGGKVKDVVAVNDFCRCDEIVGFQQIAARLVTWLQIVAKACFVWRLRYIVQYDNRIIIIAQAHFVVLHIA